MNKSVKEVKKISVKSFHLADSDAVKKDKIDSLSYIKEIKFVLRVFFAGVFFSLGSLLIKDIFFHQQEFWSYSLFIAGVLSTPLIFFGFYIFPMWLVSVKRWFESLVMRTVSDIVSTFWDQQSRKIQEARREKQKKKAEEIQAQEKRNLIEGIVVDTSVLVDGRILDFVKTGFLDKTLIIPTSVIGELQLISDSKDKLKRQRGRRGLDIVKELKKKANVVHPDIQSVDKHVDKILVDYSKEHKLKLLTLDFNLNKVADIAGVSVLNLNDLINALKTVLLPGEVLNIRIIQPGKEKKQGIGYLTDGTMVVVEGAIDRVGEDVESEVTKVIQSSAGKIIFSKIK